jgi:molybdopterin molybdotransferase
VSDDERAIADAITRGAEADILVTVGGASVGERDLVTGVLTQAGLQLDFAKVAMRPGKPTFAGRLKATRVLGLPGNPVSAIVCAIVFLRPMLRALLACSDEDVMQVGRLAEPLAKCNWRQTYHRATSVIADDGTRTVWPLPSQDSSLMSALARADCLIVQAPHTPAIPKGGVVNVLPLPV